MKPTVNISFEIANFVYDSTTVLYTRNGPKSEEIQQFKYIPSSTEIDSFIRGFLAGLNISSEYVIYVTDFQFGGKP